ncbi:alpha/beta fold hydrolase [Pseudonocardia halophobica]|uniref:alpha/beta fold hydrolase n=1 Tax=Pseudonocardia halophobica TaxID=29401 RepID=UPI003D903147
MPDSPLHVHLAGDPAGAPVLALHGVTGHGLRFRPVTEALPALRWLGVDLRGHGRSPWAPPWNLEQHVADALGVLDAHGVERAAVVGHSFGGAIATHLVRTAPECVTKLVLLDPAIGLDPQDMLETAEESRGDESYPDREAARAAKAESWAGVPAALVDAEVEAHLEERDGAWRWRYSRAALVAAWGEMAREAVVPPAGRPTLIMPATGADFVSEKWLEACRTELGEQLTVIPVDTGHMLYLERSAEVAGHLRGFLEG